MHDLDEGLPGVRLLLTSAPMARALTASVKVLTTPSADVRVEQREAHRAHGVGNVCRRSAGRGRQRVQGSREGGSEAVEHARECYQKFDCRGARPRAAGRYALVGACVMIPNVLIQARCSRDLRSHLFVRAVHRQRLAMLRSVRRPRLEPLAWVLILLALIGHSDAIMHTMRVNGPFSIGLPEAISLLAWTLAVLACLISIERQYRVLGAILLAFAALGAAVTGTGHTYAEASAPGWELTAHILLSMGAAALAIRGGGHGAAVGISRPAPAHAAHRRLAERHAALDALEKLLFRLIGTGFGLLHAGAVHRIRVRHQFVHAEPGAKTVLSLIAWLLFGVLLIGRVRYGWRGARGRALDLERPSAFWRWRILV